MKSTDPVRVGRFWLWPDGTRLPVISGGADDPDDRPDTGDDDTTSDTGDDDEPDTGDAKDWQAEARKWKRLARKHEGQAKTSRSELDKLKTDTESGKKSDMEKVQAQLQALTERAEAAERKALVAEVAQDKGLTPAQASRLRGKTREELEDDADDIVETFGIKADKAKPPKGKADDDETDDEGDKPNTEGDKPDEGDGKGGDKPASSGKPKEKLRPGASPESETGKTGQELADEVWKRAHGGM